MDEEVIGLIPAAGKGIRLGLPYPKELYPVIQNNHYKPISQFVLDNLTTAGLRHVVFVVNETKHQLIGYFGDGHRFNCNISYVVQERVDRGNESTSPGLAHALASAYHLIRGKIGQAGLDGQLLLLFSCSQGHARNNKHQIYHKNFAQNFSTHSILPSDLLSAKPWRRDFEGAFVGVYRGLCLPAEWKAA